MDFAAQNVDFFKDVLTTSKEQMKQLAEIESVKEVGVISLNCHPYKGEIERAN